MINQISPLPDFLVSRYRNWKSSLYLSSEDHFKNLASLGQNPSSMVISCCDSRVHATSIFGADAGEFFIHRNIANLVPPYSPDGENHGTSAAIEYALKELLFNVVLSNQLVGDINNDEEINVIDVVILVNMILEGINQSSGADLNGDGSVNVLDVVTLVNLILQ